MKAVYAVLSLMLAASLAWAGSSRELQICDRSEAETGRPSCRSELGNDPSAYGDRCPYRDDFHIERALQSAGSAEYGYGVSSGNPAARDNAVSLPTEIGNDPSAYDDRCPYWDDFHIEQTQQSAESEYGYGVSSGNPAARDNAISSPMEIDQGNRQVEQAELSTSVPEASSYDPGRGWPPPEEAVSLTAQNDHFWPPSAQAMPPLEFDGGQPDPKALGPSVVAW